VLVDESAVDAPASSFAKTTEDRLPAHCSIRGQALVRCSDEPMMPMELGDSGGVAKKYDSLIGFKKGGGRRAGKVPPLQGGGVLAGVFPGLYPGLKTYGPSALEQGIAEKRTAAGWS